MTCKLSLAGLVSPDTPQFASGKVMLSITADWLCRPRGLSLADEGLGATRSWYAGSTVSSFNSMKEVSTVKLHSPSLTGHSAAVPLFKPLEGFKWKWVDSTFSRQFLLGGSVPHYGAIAVFTNGPSDPARGEMSPYFRTSSPIDPGVKSALRSGATVWKYHQVSFPEVS